ncbi:hypothetical protein NSTC745_07044 [Nostoc sp. DSM 114161]|jgi:Uma2 family endonuclease
MTAITLNLEPVINLTAEQFYELCRVNPDAKLERTALGELVVMAPTGRETGSRNRRLTQRLGTWTDEDGTREAFDSSTMFQLPNGALRCLRQATSCLRLMQLGFLWSGGKH